eukprot:CAMPEP_0172899734 /NCGR_PEP_ID=MMETSP1075-20121228/162571_1 /TAXON_ID=2916 /ORGANISM="Ceratium fusus, Strain PA161109" /LENGTH=48 /DNA_ID= /DNA_START= /DNA_END= /DNA_ORIENTATION=
MAGSVCRYLVKPTPQALNPRRLSNHGSNKHEDGQPPQQPHCCSFQVPR